MLINYTENFSKDCEKDKILIAQLGKGGYQTTTYVDESGRELSTTGYGFDAIIRKENPNKLLLIGTTESGWIGIVDWYGKLKSLTKEQEKKKKALLCRLKQDTINRKENKEKTLEEREEIFDAESLIWEEIEKYIMDITEFERVKIAIIPKGQNNEELVEYFDILREALQNITQKGKNTKIIFDISNGFRSMPLYIMMIVKFVGLVNGENINYMAYYGMFEAKDEQNRTPLVNLTKVTEMTEWINAISEFRNFGSVKALYRCLSMEKEGKSEEEKEEIQQMIQKFEKFESAMNMNNLHYLKKSIEYIENLDSDFMHDIPLSRQAKVMLEDLGKDFKRRFVDTEHKLNEKYEYTYILMKLSQLYMEQGRYNMAAIASQEGIITYILEKYLKEDLRCSLFLNDEEVKEYIKKFRNRERVKSYFDAYLNKYKGEEALDKKYAFGGYYKKIKNKIRNVGAHILPDEEMPNLKEMEKWIYVSINSILKDMEETILLEHDTEIVDLNFEEIYKDYCKTNKKIKE
ncbi:MAG: TIGR02221 family CRISPR-associated protein [Lachnospiraceae bacterium]